MIDAELEEAKRLCDAATPGEWAATSGRSGSWDVDHVGSGANVAESLAREDAELIAASRQLVPRLIAALESARRERDTLADKLRTSEQQFDALGFINEANVLLAEQRDTARAEAEQLRSAQGTVIVDGLTYGEHMTRDLRAQLAQRDRDWDALVKLIATTVGTEEDRDCAENDELAEFDPWHALRTRAAEAEQLRTERDALPAQISAWMHRMAEEWEAKKLTSYHLPATLHLFARDIAKEAWRTTKGGARK